MELAQLQRIVGDAVSGTDFSLSAAAFGPTLGPVEALFKALFQNATLSMSDATASTSGDPITVHGVLTSKPTARFVAFSGFMADAQFTVDAHGGVQARLQLTPPQKAWSFTDLDQKYARDSLAAFDWSDSVFVFDTARPATLPVDFPTTFGFPKAPTESIDPPQCNALYSGKITYSGDDVALRWLLGGGTLSVSGPIVWYGDKAQFDLATDPSSPLAIGPYKLPLSFHALSVLLSWKESGSGQWVAQDVVLSAFAGRLGLPTGAPSLEIPVVINLYGQSVSLVRVSGAVSQASQLALDDVAALLGGHDLSDAQSSDFPILKGLGLKTIELVVDPRAPELVSVSATVEYTPPGGTWEVFGSDVLTFQGMRVTFALLNPLSSPTLETWIDCTLSLADGTLDAQLSLPSLAFWGELKDGEAHPIDLTRLLDEITKGAFTKLTPNFKLVCTQLKVLGDKSAGYYQFQATIKDDWSFSVNGSRFALEQIGLDVTRHVPDQAKTTGQMVALFMIANVEVQISADYTSDARGWLFSGRTLPGQAIALSNLVTDVFKKFGLSVPTAVPKITLSQLEMVLVTGTLDFGFSCAGMIDIAGTIMRIDIELGRAHDGAHSEATTTFMGYLEVGGHHFKIDFATGPTDKSISAEWTDEHNPLEFADIATAFGFKDVPQVPSSLKLSLTEASFSYDFTSKTLFITAKSKRYGSAVFIGDGGTGATTFFGFGVALDLGITLADIPLVGSKIPEGDQLGIPSACVWILSNTLRHSEVQKVNALIAKHKIPGLPKLPDEDLTARVLMGAIMKLGAGKGQPLSLSLGSTGQAGQTQVAALAGGQGSSGVGSELRGTANAPDGAATKWIDIQRRFGVFNFNRIGVRYHDNTLYFVFDAGMMLGPLSLSMDGLAVGSPLTKFVPKFDISGLGLGYNKPPLEIDGALLKRPGQELSPNTAFQFDGLATVKAGAFSLSAIGSYAQLKEGDPSLFVFAQLEAPLGDPTGTGAFFVTGLMGGFGFNRDLKIPEQNQVQGFPLLLLAQPPAPGQKAVAQTPTFVLDVLEGRQPAKPGGSTEKWIEPRPGDYWLSAGLEITSWQLVRTKALLIGAFGHDLSFALLGLSTLQLPQPGESSKTYAFAQLQLRAAFKPRDGVVSLSAVLSDASYVITPDCHLTGGFALNLWFGVSEHSGQFVVTLGGYHPAFKPPKYFPTEPRLGFRWAVSRAVSIKGGAYFALTPSCIMAGGGLEVLFHHSDLRAWFTTHSDFLLSWRPFFFIASIGTEVGVSYRLNLLFCHKTISVALGCDLKLWGPPTGGAVKVHLVVISFTVHFGSSGAAANHKPLTWDAFSQMLPHHDNMCTITARSGLHATLPNHGPSGKLWIFRAHDVRFSTHSAIPASALTYADGTPPAGSLAPTAKVPAVHLRPMDKADIDSTHNISIFKDGDAAAYDLAGWTLTPRMANVPETLWGQPSKPFRHIPEKPSANVLVGRLMGCDVTAPRPKIGPTLGLTSLKALAQEFIEPSGVAPLNKAATPSPDFTPTAKATSIADIQTLEDASVHTARSNLFQVLTGVGLGLGANGSVTELAQGASHLFTAAPMVQN